MGEPFWLLLGIAIIAYLFIGPLFGIAAHRQIKRLDKKIDGLEAALAGLRRKESFAEAGEAVAEKPRVEAPPRVAEPEPEDAGFKSSGAAPTSEETVPSAAQPEEAAPSPASASPAGPFQASPPPLPARGLEQSIASRWLLWIGAVAVCLAAVFLVRYAIEQGWLSPLVRVNLGSGTGLLLMLAGEALRKRTPEALKALIGKNYLPPSVSASGLFACFASVYAAYQLYGLIPGPLTFAVMACLSVWGFVYSMRQGTLVALIGLIGGYATPALIAGSLSSGWILAGYLLLITAASLWVVRSGRHGGLAALALAGSAAWAYSWILHLAFVTGTAPLAVFLLASACLFAAYMHLQPLRSPKDEIERLCHRGAGPAGFLIFLCFALPFASLEGYGTQSWLLLGGLTAAGFVTDWRLRFPRGVRMGFATGAAAVVCLALWHEPSVFHPPSPLLPPAAEAFSTACFLWAALFGLGGFLLILRRRGDAGGPSAIATVVPMLLLALAYWRVQELQVNFLWSMTAMALACVFLAGCALCQEKRQEALESSEEQAAGDWETALGIFACGVITAVALGLAMGLREAWLTVTFAAFLPALGWIEGRLRFSFQREAAGVVAAIVLIRLLFNPYLLDYEAEPAPLFNWLLYGYGLPMALFWFAARLFVQRKDDWLVMLLEAGAVIFLTLLVTFEVRVFAQGDLRGVTYDLFEQSLQTLSWIAVALALRWRWLRAPRPILHYAWQALIALALAQIALGHLLVNNPLFTLDPVGAQPLFNLLGLAYLLPAIPLALVARHMGEIWGERARLVLQGSSLFLVFAYLTLEVVRTFQGPVISTFVSSDAEFYGYSAVWLLYALALLAVGIWRAVPALRYVSLGLLLFTVCKVFLFDMSSLEGLFRVASFFGLGISLFLIGYVYQRFVFMKRDQQEKDTTPADA
jgi:uncharacterized membrane protein